VKDLLKLSKIFRPIDPSGFPPGLPVYRLKQSTHSIFYTPGSVSVVAAELGDNLQDLILGKPSPEMPGKLVEFKTRILHQAQKSLRTFLGFRDDTFEPECLTLYLHNQCNLDCTYCLIDRRPIQKVHLHPKNVAEGAKIVASNCKRKGLKMTEVFHGWGEPTYDMPLLQAMVKAVDGIAIEKDLQQYRYIATNGVMSPEAAEYLSRNFDLVGVSCDGSEDIQDIQRPLLKSGKTSEFIKRTASILKANGRNLSVRTTITKKTYQRQEEIAYYILKEFKPDEIHFEPVYRAGVESFKIKDAQEFVENFQRAKSLASSQGVSLIFSGSRLYDIHGPYCNIFRNVLNLIPGQKATACFAEASSSPDYRFVIGERRGVGFLLDMEKVRNLKIALSRHPESCKYCFNHSHCAGICPDECFLNVDNIEKKDHTEKFRCRVQLLMANQQILSYADQIINETKTTPLIAWKEIKNQEIIKS
jgi:sulfatase maturation enzyme AslB (radical SAM superfamily)